MGSDAYDRLDLARVRSGDLERDATNNAAVLSLSMPSKWIPLTTSLLFQKSNTPATIYFSSRSTVAQKKWTVLTNREGVPKLALDSDGFMTVAIFEKTDINPLEFCHRPMIFRDSKTFLGEAILQIKVKPERSGDVIDKDVILFWGDEKRVITGADILGRLLKGIVVKK